MGTLEDLVAEAERKYIPVADSWYVEIKPDQGRQVILTANRGHFEPNARTVGYHPDCNADLPSREALEKYIAANQKRIDDIVEAFGCWSNVCSFPHLSQGDDEKLWRLDAMTVNVEQVEMQFLYVFLKSLVEGAIKHSQEKETHG